MAKSDSSLPSTTEARLLHDRLLTGDPTAPSDLAVAYLDWLADWLTGLNPRLDPDLCTTAAEDAILALIKNPASYQPGRRALEAYLRMSASGDLKNLLRSESRHARRRAQLEAVEVSPTAGKYLWDEEADPARLLERKEDEEAAAEYSRLPAVIEANLTQEEAGVIELMQLGERKTAAYAAALGITHLPFDAQQREVKRVKDRLKKRLERSRGIYGQS